MTNGYNLPIYQIAHVDKFETYVTSKKDQTSGIDRKPNEFPFRTKDFNRYTNLPADKPR
jgi:hypothetical protein